MVLPQVSKPENLQEVGSKIRFLRKEKKMSQLELAEAIGVTQNTIYLIEKGQSEMKLGKLFSIAEVLDVTPDKLLPSEAKTTSNKLFEIEYLWKQLGETDQTIMHRKQSNGIPSKSGTWLWLFFCDRKEEKGR